MSGRAAWRLEQLGFTKVYDYTGGRKDWEAAGLPMEGSDARGPMVKEALTHDATLARVADTVGEVKARLGDDTQAVVVNDAGVIVGVMRKESWDAADDAMVGEVMRLGPATVRPGAALPPLIERMEAKDLESVLVSDAEGRFIGVLTLANGKAFLRGEQVDSTYETCESCPGWWRYRLRVEASNT